MKQINLNGGSGNLHLTNQQGINYRNQGKVHYERRDNSERRDKTKSFQKSKKVKNLEDEDPFMGLMPR